MKQIVTAVWIMGLIAFPIFEQMEWSIPHDVVIYVVFALGLLSILAIWISEIKEEKEP